MVVWCSLRSYSTGLPSFTEEDIILFRRKLLLPTSTHDFGRSIIFFLSFRPPFFNAEKPGELALGYLYLILKFNRESRSSLSFSLGYRAVPQTEILSKLNNHLFRDEALSNKIMKYPRSSERPHSLRVLFRDIFSVCQTLTTFSLRMRRGIFPCFCIEYLSKLILPQIEVKRSLP